MGDHEAAYGDGKNNGGDKPAKPPMGGVSAGGHGGRFQTVGDGSDGY
jgi:hypothetical protein